MKQLPDNFNFDVATCMLKFGAEWCGPCRAVAPVLEKVVELTGVKMFEVDIDANPDVANKFGVRSIPAVIGMKNGEAVNVIVGVHSEEIYVTLANEVTA